MFNICIIIKFGHFIFEVDLLYIQNLRCIANIGENNITSETFHDVSILWSISGVV